MDRKKYRSGRTLALFCWGMSDLEINDDLSGFSTNFFAYQLPHTSEIYILQVMRKTGGHPMLCTEYAALHNPSAKTPKPSSTLSANPQPSTTPLSTPKTLN